MIWKIKTAADIIERGMRDGLLTLNELTFFLGVPRRYIADATLAGMPTPGGRIAPSAAKSWLALNPTFRILAKVARNEKAQGKSSLPDHAQIVAERAQNVPQTQRTKKRRASLRP